MANRGSWASAKVFVFAKAFVWLALAAIFLISSSCDLINPTESEPEPPVLSYTVTPSQGQAPLQCRFLVDGQGDITNYKLQIPSLEIDLDRSEPIDTTLVFAAPGNYYTWGGVSGPGGESDGKNITVYAHGEEPPENYPPTVYISVDPASGEVPLSCRIQVWGEDPDGIDDIVSYSLEIPLLDVNNSSPAPIDTILTFAEAGDFTVWGTVVDGGDLTDLTSVDVIVSPVPEPSVSQTAELQNFTEISYQATLENLDEADLVVRRDGVTVFQTAITAPDYARLFTYQENSQIIKGNYQFTLSWDEPASKEKPASKNILTRLGKKLRSIISPRRSRDNSDIINLEIPNYLPEQNNSGLPTQIDEGHQTILNLEDRLSDKNPEDNPVLLRNAESIDGEIQVNVDGYNITVHSIQDISQNENYQVETEFGSQTGGINTSTITGTIFDLLRVHGFLEDTEMHSRNQGIIKVYDWHGQYNNQMTHEFFTLLGEINVDASGEFNQRLEHRVSNLQDYIFIQGRMVNPSTGEPESYLRRFKFPKGDISNLLIRVVPYEGLFPLSQNSITPEDFRRHVGEVSSQAAHDNPIPNPLNRDNLVKKWDFGEDPNALQSFAEVIISKANPDTLGFFNQQTAESMRTRILDPNAVGSLFAGKITNPNQVSIVEDYGPMILPDDLGKIIIYPEQNSPYCGKAYFGNADSDSYLDYGRILLKTNNDGTLFLSDGLILSHEMGHVSGLHGHAWTLSTPLTVMRASLGGGFPPDPRIADKKLGRLLYEDTYLQGTGTCIGFNDDIYQLITNDIITLNWLDEPPLEEKNGVIISQPRDGENGLNRCGGAFMD
jgi:hypothetical protein